MYRGKEINNSVTGLKGDITMSLDKQTRNKGLTKKIFISFLLSTILVLQSGIASVFADDTKTIFTYEETKVVFDQQTIDPTLADYILRPRDTKIATVTVTPTTVDNKTGAFSIEDVNIATVVDNGESPASNPKATITGVTDGLTNIKFVLNQGGGFYKIATAKSSEKDGGGEFPDIFATGTVGVDGTGPDITIADTAVTITGTTGKVTANVVDPKRGPVGKEFAVGVDPDSFRYIVKKADAPTPNNTDFDGESAQSAKIGTDGKVDLSFFIKDLIGESIKIYVSAKDRLGNATVDTIGKEFSLVSADPTISDAPDLIYIVGETALPLDGVTAKDKDGNALTPKLKDIKDKDGVVVINPTDKVGRYKAEIFAEDAVGAKVSVIRNIFVYGDIEGIATGTTVVAAPIAPKDLDYKAVFYKDLDEKNVPVNFSTLPSDAAFVGTPDFSKAGKINPDIPNIPHPAKLVYITKVQTEITIIGEAKWDPSGGDVYADQDEVFLKIEDVFTIPTFKVIQEGSEEWAITVTVDNNPPVDGTITSDVANTYTLVATAVDTTNPNNKLIKTIYVSFKDRPVVIPDINETYILKLKGDTDVNQEVNTIIDSYKEKNNYVGEQNKSSHATGVRKVEADLEITPTPTIPIDTTVPYVVEIYAADQDENEYKSLKPVTITINFVPRQPLPDSNDIVQRLYYFETGEGIEFGSVEYVVKYNEITRNIRKFPSMIHEAVNRGYFVLDRYDKIGNLVFDTDIHEIKGVKTLTKEQYENAMNFILDGGLNGAGNPEILLPNASIPQSYSTRPFCQKNTDYKLAFSQLVKYLYPPQIS